MASGALNHLIATLSVQVCHRAAGVGGEESKWQEKDVAYTAILQKWRFTTVSEDGQFTSWQLNC